MSATVKRYCLCGASVTVKALPGSAAEFVAAQFEKLHTGDGHGPATSTVAAAARRRDFRRMS